ncbi:hypothetical protein K449DRAFT_392306 [Hypoxylon sp. EC38]|nr:hypothetical protein K449DRAFT_392306 [Hypoxylon sp. EC38]
MYSKAVIVAALTASASAQMAALLPRQTETADSDFPSATESTTPECESRIQSWTAAFPTPAPQIQDALEENPDGGLAAEGVDGLCSFAVGLSKNEASAFSSYNLEMYSFLSGQSSNLIAIATSCSSDMGAPPSIITSQLNELLTVYSSYSAGACNDVTVTASASSSTTKSSTSSGFITSGLPTLTAPTNTASSTGSATTSASGSATDAANASSGSSSTAASTVSPNAGPRETGMFAAAAVAMGALGAAMVL